MIFPSPASSSRYIIGVIAKVSEELLTQRGLKGRGKGILLFLKTIIKNQSKQKYVGCGEWGILVFRTIITNTSKQSLEKYV